MRKPVSKRSLGRGPTFGDQDVRDGLDSFSLGV